MIGPRSTTLLAPMQNKFDLIPGITGDRFDPQIFPVAPATRERIVCIPGGRNVIAESEDSRESALVISRFSQTPYEGLREVETDRVPRTADSEPTEVDRSTAVVVSRTTEAPSEDDRAVAPPATPPRSVDPEIDEDRSTRVVGNPPRSAKIPDEEEC